jgi:hypothetical protein
MDLLSEGTAPITADEAIMVIKERMKVRSCHKSDVFPFLFQFTYNWSQVTTFALMDIGYTD